jgi:hypothetical protein
VLVEIAELVKARDGPAAGQTFSDLLKVRAEESKIVHETYANAQAHHSSATRWKQTTRDPLIVFFFFDGDGFQVLGLEDLTAIQAFHVIHAVAPCDDLGAAEASRSA